MSGRPWSVVAVSAALILAAVTSALMGVALSMVSGCCGSPEGSDPLAAMVGLGVGAGLTLAAVGLWSGRMPRWALVTTSAAAPAICSVAAVGSLDLQVLAPLVVLGWLTFWWWLGRDAPTRWRRARASTRPVEVTQPDRK